jgi:hypothetical protein
VSRNGWTFGESVERARAALKSGAGAAVLARLRSAQNDTRRLSTSG